MKRRDFVALAALSPLCSTDILGSDTEQKGELVKKFPCDGRCCHASPLRTPQEQGHMVVTWQSKSLIGFAEDNCDFCVFHDHSMQYDVNSGCRIMADETLLNELTEDEKDRFMKACLAYPHVWYTGDTNGPNDDECCWGKA